MTTPRPRQEPAPVFDRSASIAKSNFEYGMAVRTATLVHPRIMTTVSDDEFVIAIALIESFLVHARGLDEFLSSRGRYPTDIKASDFVPGFAEEPLDRDLRDSINQELQHITVHRQQLQKRWVPIEILPPIVESMGRFIEQLDDELADRVRSNHRRALDAL